MRPIVLAYCEIPHTNKTDGFIAKDEGNLQVIDVKLVLVYIYESSRIIRCMYVQYSYHI